MANEILGLIAGMFTLLSFLFKDQIKIREVNLIGAVLYLIYGVNLNAISIIVLNSVLITIHFWYLLRHTR